MSDHPIFVPFEGEHLAAMLTLPAGQPRGLVLMVRGLPGRITARIAWALADAGIASLRLDAPGRGDSTGTFRSGREASAVPWIATAIEVVRRATGIQRIAMIGYCQAAATAVEVAAATPSVGLVLIVVRGGAFRDSRTGAARTDGASPSGWLRRVRRLGRRAILMARGRRQTDRSVSREARRLRRLERPNEVHPRHILMEHLSRAARTTDILALHIGDVRAAPRVEQRAAALRRVIGSPAHRFEVRHIDSISRGFRIPSDRLDDVAATMAGWLDEVIDRPLEETGLAGSGRHVSEPSTAAERVA